MFSFFGGAIREFDRAAPANAGVQPAAESVFFSTAAAACDEIINLKRSVLGSFSYSLVLSLVALRGRDNHPLTTLANVCAVIGAPMTTWAAFELGVSGSLRRVLAGTLGGVSANLALRLAMMITDSIRNAINDLENVPANVANNLMHDPMLAPAAPLPAAAAPAALAPAAAPAAAINLPPPPVAIDIHPAQEELRRPLLSLGRR